MGNLMNSSSNVHKSPNGAFNIDCSNIYRGRCAFVATLVSEGLFHNYNLDSTEIGYMDNEEYKTITSNNVLSEHQILSLLYILRMQNCSIKVIRHIYNDSGYRCKIEVTGIDSDVMEVIYPEDTVNEVDSIMNRYYKSDKDFIHRTYRTYIEDTDINKIVTSINKLNQVLGVNKVKANDSMLSIIESEDLIVVIADNELLITEIYNSDTSRILVKEVCKELCIHSKNISKLIMI